MATPTTDLSRDAFEELSGFDLSPATTEALVAKWIDLQIRPYVEQVCRQTFTQVTEYTEYHDGTGNAEMMVDRRPVQALIAVKLLTLPADVLSIPVSAVEVIGDQGILRVRAVNLEAFTFLAPIWPKGLNNIKLTYTAGFADYPAGVRRAIALMAAARILGHEAAFTGGGTSTGMQSFNRSYNSRGRHGEFRSELIYEARSLLRPYKTSVVGR